MVFPVLAAGGLLAIVTVAEALEGGLDLERVEPVEVEGRRGVSLALSGAPEKVATFTLSDPPRLVIDVHGPVASDAGANGETALDHPYVRRVRVGRHERRLRLVLDLEPEAPDPTVNDKDTVVIALFGEPVEPPPAATKPASVPNAVAAWVLPEAVASETAPEGVVAPKEAPADPPMLVAAVTREEPRPKRARDPFRPFNLDVTRKIAEPRTPLERYEVGALKLVAIIFDTQDPRAMVEDGAQLGHTIGVGTRIGSRGGVVKMIEADRVIIEEERVDFYGETRKAEIVLRLEQESL